MTTIQVDSSLSWNVACPLNDTAEVQDILEVSIYDSLSSIVDELLSVSVNEVCGEQVRRRLQQQNASLVGFSMVLSSVCNGCGDDMYNKVDSALNETLQDGTLNDAIQENSNGQITAEFDTTYVTVNVGEISDPPTKAPTKTPTEAPTPSPFEPESPGDLPTNRPTPRPSTGTKSSKDSKTSPPPTRKPTPSPTNAKSGKRVRA